MAGEQAKFRGVVRRLAAGFVIVCALARGQGSAQKRAWSDFEAWVRESPAAAGGPHVPVLARYAEKLRSEGVLEAEAVRRVGIINQMRIGSESRQRVYYDAVYKFGGGPEDAIRYLVECARERKPGAALDVAMGNGRNGLYLAGQGWTVTGYDISTVGVEAARRRAEQMGIRIEAVEASHDTFDWGVDKWDLVVVSYATMWDWGVRLSALWRALRPGGVIVCDHACADLAALLHERKPKGFRLLDYRDSEKLNEGWGLPNTKIRRVQALVVKAR